ncbi:MAG: AsnC family transcriptional regulator [Firmicutes bacterium]|nr:AsnC family transcriptional regulator [Bacillota bacterium]
MAELTPIHEEILRILRQKDSSYAYPVKSQEIGDALNVSASYVREMTALLQGLNLVRARRGRGGGYYLNDVLGSNTINS